MLMLKLYPYMLFDGTCAAAMRFYEKILAGQIEVMTSVGDSPMASQFPPESAKRIIHARLRFDNNVLMASDWMAPEPYSGMQGTRFTLASPSATEAKRIYAALADGGTVEMPIQKTGWAEAYGMLVDRYGAPWQVMTE
jgi:PhnB protein